MQAKATKPCRVRGARPTPMLDCIGERISCWNAKQRVWQALDLLYHPPVNPRHRRSSAGGETLPTPDAPPVIDPVYRLRAGR